MLSFVVEFDHVLKGLIYFNDFNLKKKKHKKIITGKAPNYGKIPLIILGTPIY